MKSPQVSIIMATYNREHYILDSLKSIQNQVYQFWECIIIDDGGTDNTSAVVSSFMKDDERFSYQKRPSSYAKGLPGCRNFGLDIAKGDFIIFFDDDDIIHPLNLKVCVDELSNADYSFCRYRKENFEKELNLSFDLQTEYDSFQINSSHIFDFISDKLPISSCSVMWKAECFKENRFQEDLMYAEEWELYARLLVEGYSGISIGKTLYYARKHEQSNTSNFYNNDPVRVGSKIKAMALIVETLRQNKLLSFRVLRYLINATYKYRKTVTGLPKILEAANVSTLQKIYWNCYYAFLPVKVQMSKLIKKNG